MKSTWWNSRAGYFADLAITPAILIAVLAQIGGSMIWAAVGLLAWQPYEWAVHRLLFHGPLHRLHWMHHRDPTGDSGIPTIITIPFLLGLLAALTGLCGRSVGGGLFVGLGVGYWTYNVTHWAIHAGYWPATGPLAGVARRHLLHHRGAAANFNVLFPLVDLLAGTYRRA